MDSAFKVLQYFADAPLEEAKRTVDLAMLIVLGRRGEPGDRSQDPALKPHRREAGTVRAYAARILRENGKPLPISVVVKFGSAARFARSAGTRVESDALNQPADATSGGLAVVDGRWVPGSTQEVVELAE